MVVSNTINTDECFGYARCSKSKVQDAEYEIRALMKKGIKKENIFIDYMSGAREDRTQFNRLLKIVKPGISSIYCTEITRLARSTRYFCEVLEYIENNKLRLVVNTLEVDCRSEKLDVMVESMLKISAVFGEIERKLKIFQINLGLENARSKGIKLGRKKVDSIDQIPDIFLKYYPRYAIGELNKAELSRICNLSYPTIFKYLEIVERKNKVNK